MAQLTGAPPRPVASCQAACVSELASDSGPRPVDLGPVRTMVAGDHGLATVAVVRPDGTPHVSLVNAGVLDHPRTGEPVAAYVTYGKVKLRALATRS